jgi:hypothetical protein
MRAYELSTESHFPANDFNLLVRVRPAGSPEWPGEMPAIAGIPG